MATAIEFDNISKLYRLGMVSTGTLRHDLNRWWTVSVRGKDDPYMKVGETNDRSSKGESDYVWALKDIDFKVEQGDVVGIIGKNGAGKSTLLKLLSKVTAPTTGVIRARGRIGSLLEVGTGFHQEMTGRENIYMNGAILGMTKQEITSKLDEIVDFSGCERYIDTPVKRYSSGMMVRLGFAVAAHLDPEILVVDEVLAVGDAEFQKKAIGKMQDVSKGEGRTVLFVSHNMAAVKSLCKTGIVLNNGGIQIVGSATEAVDYYLNNSCMSKTPNYVQISEKYRDSGFSRDIEFISFKLKKESATYASDEDVELEIVVRGNRGKNDCRINCTIWDSQTEPIGSVVSMQPFDVQEGEVATINYIIKHSNLAIGRYTFTFSIGTGDVLQGLTLFDAVKYFITFEIDKIHSSSNEYYAVWKKEWGNIFFQSDVQKKTSTYDPNH